MESQQNEPASVEQPPQSWTVHPARMHPGRGLLGLVVILLSSWAIATLIDSPSWRLPIGLAVAGLLFISVNRFFLPSTFELDNEGITARYPLRSVRLRWKDLRRFLVGERGGLLSRRARSSSMDLFTGMQVLFDDQRDQWVKLIRSRMAGNGVTT